MLWPKNTIFNVHRGHQNNTKVQRMSDFKVKMQLRKAQEQLAHGNFQEARNILRYLDHPDAQRVLAELDEILSIADTAVHPRVNPSPRPDWVVPLLAIVALFICMVLFWIVYSS